MDSIVWFNHKDTKAQRSFFNRGGAETRRNTGEDSSLCAQSLDSVLFFNHKGTKAQRGFSEISGGLLSVFHRRGAETRRNTEGHSSLCAQSLCLGDFVVPFLSKQTHREVPSFSSSPKASIGDLFNRCPIKALGHDGSFIPTVAGGLL